MEVKKVTPEDVEDLYCCISPGSLWTEQLSESREWFKAHLGKYVEGYHLRDGPRTVGLIYYGVSENALVPYKIEPNVACIYCTELLKEYMHRGYGRMMFDYMKKDLKNQGFKGIMIPATEFKEWMHYELFLKQGFTVIKEHSPYKVMYFPLTKESVTINIINLNYAPSRDKIEVTLFRNFFCPVGVYMHHLIKKVAQTFGDRVRIVEIEATPEIVRRYGTADPLINGKIKLYGPASEEGVKKAIEEEINL